MPCLVWCSQLICLVSYRNSYVGLSSFVICSKCEILIIDTWNDTSRKAMELLICFSIVNLMLGCLLFNKFKKFNESCSLSKVARMSYLSAFDNEQDSLNFLNNGHPNVKFRIEKQINHSIVFLDVFISGINNENLTFQTYHKSTYTGILLNFKSFTSFSYKISLIKCLIGRSFKICNNWRLLVPSLLRLLEPWLIMKLDEKIMNESSSVNYEMVLILILLF